MFGYVMPKENELDANEQAVYRSYYCGLCKSIKRHYGPVSSCFLTYECTFLALLLNAVSEEDSGTAQCHCLHACRDKKRQYCIDSPSISFAAGVNILLVDAKLKDDITDNRRLKARLLRLLIMPSVHRARKAFPCLWQRIESYLNEQQQAERTMLCADDAAHPTGVFLMSLAEYFTAIPKKEQPVLEWFLYHLGRWIYFADAVADKAEDASAGRYNVFLSGNEDPAFCMNVSLNECRKALDLLTLSRDRGLLENIISEGCGCKTMELLRKGGIIQDESL